MAAKEKGGVVLTKHRSCARRERVGPGSQPGHIISLGRDSHLSAGHSCTEQGLQQLFQLNTMAI
jgi:hypothetical protein